MRSWSSTERNRPKSFFACFSARYNLEQVVNVRDRHMYEMPPPALPTQSASSALPSPTQANININVSCADDSSTADSSLEDGKDFLAGLGGPNLHQSPVYSQAVNTAAVDGLKVLALIWICIANFYLLGYQPQMLPSVGKSSSVYL